LASTGVIGCGDGDTPSIYSGTYLRFTLRTCDNCAAPDEVNSQVTTAFFILHLDMLGVALEVDFTQIAQWYGGE